MQAIMLERQDERIQKMTDAFDEMANTITRLEAERFHLQTKNILLQAENTNLRTQIVSLEALNLKFQRIVYGGVGRTQKKEGCLVLLVAGLSAFSLFTIYQT